MPSMQIVLSDAPNVFRKVMPFLASVKMSQRPPLIPAASIGDVIDQIVRQQLNTRLQVRFLDFCLPHQNRPPNRAADMMEDILQLQKHIQLIWKTANMEESAHEVFAGEASSNSVSEDEDSGYSSSATSASEFDNEEVFAAKRKYEPRSKPAGVASKAQRKDDEKESKSKKRETQEPVKNPLTDEQKKQRRETRAHNWQTLCEGIAGALLKDCAQSNSTHYHLKHFCTDLHRVIDRLCFHLVHTRKGKKHVSADQTPGEC
jgi:hypothetical protein